MNPRDWFRVGVRLIGVVLVVSFVVTIPSLVAARSYRDAGAPRGPLAVMFATAAVMLGSGAVLIMFPAYMDWTADGLKSIDGLSDTPRQRDTR